MRIRRTFALLFIFALLLSSSTYRLVIAQEDSHYFAETGHTVSGKFLQYWQMHGGLAQFGYPISEELQEISPLDGRIYTVQYFERAEFELHPENQPPYNVLLSQLGTVRYKEKYPIGAGAQAPDPIRSLFFHQTGKHIGGIFRDYWEQHGGLAQQGYPISEEFNEVSDVNGRTYLVQYFERSVLEYHPENNPPYNVLLSPLGQLRYDEIGQPVPPPHYNPTHLIASDVYATGGSYTFHTVIAAGHYLLWQRSDHDIYGYDLNSGTEFPIAISLSEKWPPLSDGQYVAWLQASDTNPDMQQLHVYNLVNGDEHILFEGAAIAGADSQIILYALDSGLLYYQIHGYGPIHALRLSSEQETTIIKSGTDLVVSDGSLIWFEQPRPDDPDNFNHLRVRKIGSSDDSIIAKDNFNFNGYNAYGDSVAWCYLNPGPEAQGVYLYNITTNQNQRISTDDAAAPLISGNKVVWTSWQEDKALGQWRSTIMMYDIGTQKTSSVVVPDGSIVAAMAIISPGTLLYVKYGSDAYVEVFSVSLSWVV